MKKTLSLILVCILALSVLALTGCKKNNDTSDQLTGPERYKEKYGFEAHVEEDSEIIGEWIEESDKDSNSAKIVWKFEDNGTLFVVEALKEPNTYATTDGAFNYNEKDGKIEYLLLATKGLNEKAEPIPNTIHEKATVSIDDDKMTFTYEDGTTDTFIKK